jgi:hypothetical protein
MNDLTPTEMMFIYDAVLNFSQREECASHPTLPEHFIGILDKMEAGLAARGYHLKHLTTYTVK